MTILNQVKIIVKQTDSEEARLVRDVVEYFLASPVGVQSILEAMKTEKHMKKCIDCGKFYEIKDFGKRRSRCKYCMRVYNKRYQIYIK